MEVVDKKPRARKRGTGMVPSPMNAARREFLGRWMAYGSKLFVRAEAFGIEWRNMPMEKVEAAVVFAEEWAKGQEEPHTQNAFGQ